MAKQHLLVVDDDPQSLQLMEVSLRKAGFVVTTAADGAAAFEIIEAVRPALVLSDTDMPGMDGYALCSLLKADARFSDVPFIFLTDETSVDARIRGLELGADDSLSRPIYTRELITRVRMALEREKRRSLSSQHRFFGDLADMSVLDLLQAIEIGRKSGQARILSGGREGVIWFAEGQVADAAAGALRGEEAVFRLLTWEAGTFEMDFRAATRAVAVDQPTQALLMEGVRRIDEWSRISEQLPSLGAVLQVDYVELSEHLDSLPPAVHDLLRLFDGRRTAQEVVDEAHLPDLEALKAISRLYFEGVLYEAPTASAPVEAPLVAAAPEREPEPEFLDVVLEEITAPPPRVTRSRPTPPPEQPNSRGLVDDLIRSAVNLPAMSMERARAAAAAKAEGEARAQQRAEMIAAAARRESARPPRRQTPVQAPVAPPRLTPPDPLPGIQAEPPRAAEDGADLWASVRPDPPAESAAPIVGFPEEDLLGVSQPTSRAAYVALALLVVVIGALIAFMMRDTVEPFTPPEGALAKGWHKAALKAAPNAPAPAPLSADWTLPTGEGAPVMGAAPLTDAAEAPEDRAAPDPAPRAAGAPDLPPPAPPGSEPFAPAPADDGFSRLFAEGRALHGKGQFKRAAATLGKAVKRRPDDAEAQLLYADALLESQQDDAALSAARAALRMKPSAAKAHLIIGTVNQIKGRTPAAIEAYERYLVLAPKSRYAPEVRNILRSLQ